MPSLRTVGALVASLVLPVAAAAEPLTTTPVGSPSPSPPGPAPMPAWSYTTSFHAAGLPDMNSTFILYGGTGAGGSYSLNSELRNPLDATPASTFVGSQTIPVGLYNIVTLNSAYQGPPTLVTAFNLDVTIRDLRSGETSTAAFVGSFTSELTENWPPNPTGIAWASPTARSLSLGGNVYNLTLEPNDPMAYNPAQTGTIRAQVKIGSVDDTPEPATFVLAGLGAAVVGLVRLRRRCGTDTLTTRPATP